MTNKKNKKNQSDTLYHILFWIIVIAIFPISLSVWFYRTKRFDFSKQLRKIILAVFWAVVAVLLIIAIAVSAGKKKPSDDKGSSEAEVTTASSEDKNKSESKSGSETTEEEDTSELKITFLDMTQADAILVSCDGHYMIVDSGDMSSLLSARLFELEPELKNIDYIVASTPFNESVGGFARALPYYTIGKAFCSVKEYDSEKFKDFKESLSNIELEIPRIGQSLDLGSAKVTFLGPNAESEEIGSVVLKIDHKDTSVLLSGNAQAADLQYLIDSGYDISADIIKVGAHGQDGALSAEVMQKVSPEYAVISSGSGYGCPSDETILYLSNAKVKTYRTDLQGNISLTSDKNGVKFEVTGDENADTTKIEGSDTPDEQTTEENNEQGQEGQEDTPAPEAPPEETTPAENPTPEDTQPQNPDQPGESPAEPVTDANGYTYAKKVSDNYFHRLDCPEIAGMTYPELEKYNVSRDTIINEWRTLTPCPVCNP